MSPTQRFKRMVTHAHDVISLEVDHYGKPAKEVKLTTNGEGIIFSKKPTTETVDRLALAVACSYQEDFSSLVDQD